MGWNNENSVERCFLQQCASIAHPQLYQSGGEHDESSKRNLKECQILRLNAETEHWI
jgi:hypothetical protein